MGTVTTAPYSMSVANLAAGSYSFTAVATDNQSATTSSTAVSINVQGQVVAAGTASWSLNQAALHDPKLGWVHLLLNLVKAIAQGRACVPGDVIERDDEVLKDLEWPDSVARLLVSPVDATDLDNMMFLVPLTAAAKVGTVAQRMSLQAKWQKAKWSALAVMS